ncbi:MAG: SLC13 family permease [Phycisphaerales bacterium]|nr:SLC13 family permease [Phycisphaerales bacterium]
MDVQGWLTLGVIVLALAGLASGRAGADLVLVGAVSVLVFLGVLTPGQALSGMASTGVATVGVLYIVVAGLVETGAVRWGAQVLFGKPTGSVRVGAARLTGVAAVMSGFVNNTPLVALLIPAVQDWCRRRGVSVSRMLMPLSYAAILGGTTTLIGTSTNLVVSGAWQEHADANGLARMGMFEIAWVGVPVMLVGLCYLFFVAPRLLPERKPVLDVQHDPRSYTTEMIVETGSALVGKTIEGAGLRQLPGLYLAEIEREGQLFAAVGPDEVLRAEDRLVFVGIVDSVVDLQRIRGLKPATDQVVKLGEPRPQRVLVEAVVSNTSPLVGRTIREGRFRSRYGAVVIAVARNGERVNKKIGDIAVRAGDTLLLEAPRAFAEQHKNSRDFFLVSEVSDFSPVRHEKALIAIGILALMIVLATTGVFGFTMLHAGVLAAGLLIVTRCLSGYQARRAVDWQVLVVIAASLALGRALHESDAATALGNGLLGLAGRSPMLTLALVYLATMLLTEIVTNNAAAVLMFTITQAAAEAAGLDLRPLAIAIMMAASASFSTPIGYQTNLMVMGPGGYKFSDFLRVGVPLNALCMLVTIVVIPMVWPLR